MAGNRNKQDSRSADTTKPKPVQIPAGMVPILNDPMNPTGFKDPNTGYEYYPTEGGKYLLAWTWVGNEKRYRTPAAKQASANVQNAGSKIVQAMSSGAPVGGQAGSPGDTGVVGDLQSRSNAPATSLGFGDPNRPSPPQMPVPVQVMTPVPSQPTMRNQDIGTVPMPSMPVPIPAPQAPVAITPEENLITTIKSLQIPVARPEMGLIPQRLQAGTIPMPAMPVQQEAQPWWRQYLSYIGL